MLTELSKNGCQITTLSTIHLLKEKMLRAVFWHPTFGDMSQSEKLSEIKQPFVEGLDFFPSRCKKF
jgi:hypothetical protein